MPPVPKDAMTEPTTPDPALDAAAAETAAALFKTLANPMRLRLLAALRAGPLAVGALQDAVDAPQSAVSVHLMRMRGDGLVTCHRSAADARIMLYALADPRIVRLLDTALAR
ncbi:MAG: metalloregulator ArsR/SmtB family transcription factor [Alphaproteobacteria bacterium]|nr:metalloregulator ArsR/SmtB family transcription factor [Alphaproteobacteria bacterium]